MNKDKAHGAKPNRIEITAQEVQALIERAKQEGLFKQDYPIVVAVLRNYFTLD